MKSNACQDFLNWKSHDDQDFFSRSLDILNKTQDLSQSSILRQIAKTIPNNSAPNDHGNTIKYLFIQFADANGYPEYNSKNLALLIKLLGIYIKHIDYY